MSLWKNKNWTPMLLKEVNEPFNSKKYIYELKFDGIRAIIYVSPDTFIIKNRHNKEITNLYPELNAIKENIKDRVIFDGEIIALDNGLPSFSKLQTRSHLKDLNKINWQAINNPVIFIAYDILYLKNDLIAKTLMERKKILKKFIDTDYFIKSKYIENYGIELFKKIQKLSLEGIVAKEKESIYEINKRSSSWLKIKNFKTANFFIGGFVEKSNLPTISLILGEYKDSKLIYVGNVVLNKKTKLYEDIKKLKVIKTNPFFDFKEKVNFVKPKLTCEVSYIERTKNNHLREPVIKKNT